MTDDKKTFRKSDLWLFTLAFGAITAGCLAYLAVHLARGEHGEALTMGVLTLIPLTLTIVFGFTDRSEAMRREELFRSPVTSEASARWATKLSQEIDAQSGLDPENSDRAKDAMSKDSRTIG